MTLLIQLLQLYLQTLSFFGGLKAKITMMILNYLCSPV